MPSSDRRWGLISGMQRLNRLSWPKSLSWLDSHILANRFTYLVNYSTARISFSNMAWGATAFPPIFPAVTYLFNYFSALKSQPKCYFLKNPSLTFWGFLNFPSLYPFITLFPSHFATSLTFVIISSMSFNNLLIYWLIYSLVPIIPIRL